MVKEVMDMKWTKWAWTIAVPVVGGMASGYIANRLNAKNEQTKAQYEKMKQPPFSPPTAVFPIVWPILYTTMGVAHGLVKQKEENGPATKLYYSQLGANFLWSYLYFGKQNKEAGLVDIAMLLGLVGATTSSFYKVDKTAARLMLPYLGWTAFATYLNAGTIVLNQSDK